MTCIECHKSRIIVIHAKNRRQFYAILTIPIKIINIHKVYKPTKIKLNIQNLSLNTVFWETMFQSTILLNLKSKFYVVVMTSKMVG